MGSGKEGEVYNERPKVRPVEDPYMDSDSESDDLIHTPMHPPSTNNRPSVIPYRYVSALLMSCIVDPDMLYFTASCQRRSQPQAITFVPKRSWATLRNGKPGISRNRKPYTCSVPSSNRWQIPRRTCAANKSDRPRPAIVNESMA